MEATLELRMDVTPGCEIRVSTTTLASTTEEAEQLGTWLYELVTGAARGMAEAVEA